MPNKGDITWHPEGVPIFHEGSQEWIEYYGKLHGTDYAGVMLWAKQWLEGGIQFKVRVHVRTGPDHHQQHFITFWKHYEQVTFTRVPAAKKIRFIVYL